MDEIGLDTKSSIDLLKALIDSGISYVLPFQGSSMLPSFKTGDTVILVKVQAMRVGKVYVYSEDDERSFFKLVCHRLQSYQDDTYIFRGDNRKLADRPVKRDAIIAEVRL